MVSFVLDSRSNESQFLAISTHRSLDQVIFLPVTGSLMRNITKRNQESRMKRGEGEGWGKPVDKAELPMRFC